MQNAVNLCTAISLRKFSDPIRCQGKSGVQHTSELKDETVQSRDCSDPNLRSGAVEEGILRCKLSPNCTNRNCNAAMNLPRSTASHAYPYDGLGLARLCCVDVNISITHALKDDPLATVTSI